MRTPRERPNLCLLLCLPALVAGGLSGLGGVSVEGTRTSPLSWFLLLIDPPMLPLDLETLRRSVRLPVSGVEDLRACG